MTKSPDFGLKRKNSGDFLMTLQETNKKKVKDDSTLKDSSGSSKGKSTQ